MNNTNEIRHRIKSVKDTRQITKAMELISISKMKRALTRYENNAVYFDSVRYTIKDILMHSHDIEHKYTMHRLDKRAAYIVIAGDKGLAGGYNHNVLNMAWEHMQIHEQRYIITIGQIAREFFESKNQQVDLEFTHVSQSPTLHDARGICRDILNLYDQNLMDEVYVVYTKLITTINQKPKIIKLLPVEIDDLEDIDVKSSYTGDILYDPTPKAVLNVLVPQYLVGAIFATLVQSVASEQCARMVAMNSANKNADKMLTDLNLQYNRARQEKVTNELLEIVSILFSK